MDDRPAFIVEDAKRKTRPIVVRMNTDVADSMVEEFDKVIAERK